jgi:hypothetical protein
MAASQLPYWNVPHPTGHNNIVINANATQIAANPPRVTDLAPGTTPRQFQFGISWFSI